MATVSSLDRPFFRFRLGVSILSVVGFLVCLNRLESPPTAVVSVEKPGKGKIISSRAANPVIPEPRAPAVRETEADPADPDPVLEPVVMMDPGHGGQDGGTVGNGLIEKNFTLKVGLALADELKSRGHRVELTRDTDETLALLDRPPLVNAAPRVALLSVHFNAGVADASGVETWYSWPKKPEVMALLQDAGGNPLPGVMADDSQRLAMAVQEGVQARTGARDRGIRNAEDLAMTSRTVCPAVLVECGFLSNGSESGKIQDSRYRKKIVLGIADGYESWLQSRQSPLVTVPVGPLRLQEPGNAEH